MAKKSKTKLSRSQSSGKVASGYRRSVFTFLDILGFRRIVENSDPETVKGLLATLREEAMPDERLSKKLESSFMTFSDCTVRSIPIDSKSNKKYPDGILWNELFMLVRLQYRMAVKGYLLRGGMTIDDIYMDGSTVFGPAINKAYGLESEFAVYPRIVVDPVVFEQLAKEPLLRYHDEWNEEWEHISGLVCRDSDGLYFVDYMRGIMTELDNPGDEFIFLSQHKELIQRSVRDIKKMDKIAAKYLWLATYHNTVVQEMSDDFFQESELEKGNFLITSDDFPLLFDHR